MKFGIEIFIIEIIGIIAFTISGVIVAFKKRFDLLGVVTLGTLTAVGGGALRDILLGVLPPSMFRNGIYVLIAFITAIVSFFLGIFSIKKNVFIIDRENTWNKGSQREERFQRSRALAPFQT